MIDSNRRIMVIENDQDFSYLLYTLFKQEYFAVLPVFNSYEVMDRFMEFQPQVISLNLDLFAGRLDQLALVSALHVPLVAYSVDDIDEAALPLVTEFFQKPFNFYTFLERVDRLMTIPVA